MTAVREIPTVEYDEDFERFCAAGGAAPAGPEPRVPAVSVAALALAEELRALPLAWRKAIVLHHLVGMPVQEAARTLGVPAGTVKTWLARGRRALAARLGDEQGAVHHD